MSLDNVSHQIQNTKRHIEMLYELMDNGPRHLNIQKLNDEIDHLERRLENLEVEFDELIEIEYVNRELEDAAFEDMVSYVG